MEFLHSPTAVGVKLAIFIVLSIGLSVWSKNRMDRILTDRMEDDGKSILPVYWKAIASGLSFAVLGTLFGGFGIFFIPTKLLLAAAAEGQKIQGELIPILVGMAVGIGLVLLLRRLGLKNASKCRRPNQSLVHPQIVFFLPCSQPERRLWILVSICAGVFEEIAFRGYFFHALHALGCTLFLVWGLNALLFGALHIYQGWKGFIYTGLLGLFMAFLYSLSGLLIVPIIAHVLFDLRILLMKPEAIASMRKAARAASNAAQVSSA